MARGRAPDAAGGRAGAGSFADACHSLPRQEREEGMHCCYYTRAAIWDAVKGGWVTLPGGGGCEEGLPDAGRHDPPLIPAGLLFPGTFYVAGPVLGALHTRTLTVSEGENTTPIWQMKKLRLTCPGLIGHKWSRRDPSPAMSVPSDPITNSRRKMLKLNPLRLKVTSCPGEYSPTPSEFSVLPSLF